MTKTGTTPTTLALPLVEVTERRRYQTGSVSRGACELCEDVRYYDNIIGGEELDELINESLRLWVSMRRGKKINHVDYRE